MKIYILYDGAKVGPYSWIDIFIKLRKGELAYDALAEIEGEPKPKTLDDLGLWAGSAEVGPFTWSEISILLAEGCIDLQCAARLEGCSELSTLQKVIAKSSEVSLPVSRNVLQSVKQNFLNTLVSLWSSFLTPKYALAWASAIVLVAGIFVYFNRVRPAPQSVAESTSFHASRVTSTPTPLATTQEKVPSALSEIIDRTPRSEDRIKVKTTQADTPHRDPQTGTIAVTSASDEEAPVGNITAKPASSATNSLSPTSISTFSPSTASSHLATTTVTPSRPSFSNTSEASPSPAQTVTYTNNFFKIESVKFIKEEPKDSFGVWSVMKKKTELALDKFLPCLEVRVSAAENVRSNKLVAKAYFFDQDNKLIASLDHPSQSGNKTTNLFEMPILFTKNKTDRFFFKIPPDLADKKWKAVVIFGDKDEVKSACFPTNERDFLLDYPEKTLVYNRTVKKVERRPVLDPLIEHVVKTRNPKMPEFTLFLRPPTGITDASEIKGVLAICVLGNNIETIKRQLQKDEMDGDYNGIFGFANQNKLAIIAWGSRTLWNPGMNNENLERAQERAMDESFDLVADAWERGVKELSAKYGLPTKDYLLWGSCGSAQWAHRLCLRKPAYFLAIDIHIPGSFDKPTPEANRVLWCLTTGELYGGYERSKQFVTECRNLGYPIVYKAIVGLGHSGHPDATAMGFEFFKFALTQKKLRDQYDAQVSNSLIARSDTPNDIAPQPWPNLFQHPPFYGDMVNQEIYPADKVDMIPAAFRIPLPTEDIAKVWNRGNE